MIYLIIFIFGIFFGCLVFPALEVIMAHIEKLFEYQANKIQEKIDKITLRRAITQEEINKHVQQEEVISQAIGFEVPTTEYYEEEEDND